MAISKVGQILEKEAFSVTPEGHEYDAERYQADAEYLRRVVDAKEDYADKAPFRAFLSDGIAGRPLMSAIANKAEYSSGKHRAGRNDMNLFAGYTRPRKRED